MRMPRMVPGQTSKVAGQYGVVVVRRRVAGDRQDLHGRYREHKRMGVLRSETRREHKKETVLSGQPLLCLIRLGMIIS